MDSINRDELIELLNTMAADMIAAKETLNGLDGAIGDGDLGITMTLGFQAIQQELAAHKDDDMQAILSASGMAFADNAASTFGALLATMFMQSGRTIKGKTTIGSEEAAAMLKAAAEGVQKRGKANLGDKTVLDAMIPASEAFTRCAQAGQSLPACMDEALKIAREGAEKTTQMRSKIGRAGWLGDRTVGAMDPGSAAFVMLLESATKFVKSH